MHSFTCHDMKQIGLEGEDLGLPFTGGNSSVQWAQGPTLAKNWPGTWYKVRISQSMHIQFALLGLMSGAMQMKQQDKTLTKTTLNQYQFINLIANTTNGPLIYRCLCQHLVICLSLWHSPRLMSTNNLSSTDYFRCTRRQRPVSLRYAYNVKRVDLGQWSRCWPLLVCKYSIWKLFSSSLLLWWIYE